MIDLENVTKQFDGRRLIRHERGDVPGGAAHEPASGRRRQAAVVALDGVNLRVERGELVSIVGPSGSGKSTLLNLVGGLDRPTSGVIAIDGQRFDALGDDELTRVRRDKIGFIFQFFNLLPTLTCLENVGLPLHLRGWSRKKVTDRARELLDLVGLGRRVDHLPEEWSGGERQRVAIARALVGQPLCVLLDEPTGNLDRHTAESMHELMLELNRELQTCFVVVTHDPLLAERMDRVLHLRDGQLVAV